MKPTKTQKIVIDAVINQLKFWRDTNDINSPTHYCDMDECYNFFWKTVFLKKKLKNLRQRLVTYFSL